MCPQANPGNPSRRDVGAWPGRHLGMPPPLLPGHGQPFCAARDRHRAARAGFTLIELIVVVMLLAIAAAVVVPQAMDTSDMQAMAAARTTASDLEYARDLAVTTTDRVTVTLDVSGESYVLTNTSGAIVHPITKAPAYTVNFATQRGFERVDVETASFGSSSAVTFDETGVPAGASGSPLAENGQVRISAGASSYLITVEAGTGKVTVN